MNSLQEKALHFGRWKGLFTGCRKLLVAVSGGPDSMALLYLAKHVFVPEWGMTLHVAHLNHQLRGADSNLDADLVTDVCRRWGIPCTVECRDVGGSRQKGDSLEHHARNVRYGFLQEVRKKVKANCIATAHHRDDQVETLVMCMIKGTGLKGMRGILPKRDDGVVRPLLTLTKQEILAFLRQHRIPFREDQTNRDPHFLRNRVRANLVPALQKATPGFAGMLLRTAESAAEAWGGMEANVRRELLSRITTSPNGSVNFDLRRPSEPGGVVLREFLGMVVERPTRLHVEALTKLIKRNPGKRVLLPGGLSAWRTSSGIMIEASAGTGPPEPVDCVVGRESTISAMGITLGSGLMKSIPPRFPGDSAEEAFFDADKIGEKWLLRTWKPGDRIRPLGLKGTRKVADLLAERGVPVPDRRSVPVMEVAGRIAWVVGHRIGDDFKINGETKRYLKVYLKREK